MGVGSADLPARAEPRSDRRLRLRARGGGLMIEAFESSRLRAVCEVLADTAN